MKIVVGIAFAYPNMYQRIKFTLVNFACYPYITLA